MSRAKTAAAFVATPRFYRREHVIALIGLPESTFRRMMALGEIPAPDKYLGTGTGRRAPIPLWRRSTLDEWMDKKNEPVRRTRFSQAQSGSARATGEKTA